MSAQPEASSSTLPNPQPPLCSVCHDKPAIYTCPRCSMRTCTMSCSNQHKTLGVGCSGVRNKAAYVPMNEYGYMSLMSDYTFLEEMGRKVGDCGREIVQGGFTANAAGAGRGRIATSMRGGRGRGRGRGAGAAGGKTRSKRDVLKMQLDFRDIEMEMLPNGMERRILNQSTWDFKNRTALLTIELRFHPPPDPLQPSSHQTRQPFSLLTHRNALEKPLLEAMRAQVAERKKSKKGDPFPKWISPLVFPDPDDPDGFTMPVCVMRTPLDPLASLKSRPESVGPRPGHVRCEAYYKLDPTNTIGVNLKHKNFVEFPTIEIWEDGSFRGTIVDDQGSVQREAEEPLRKRRKLSVREGKRAIHGLLGGYGSDEEGEETEEKNVLDLLGGYAGSDDEETGQAADGPSQASGPGLDEEDDGLCDEDAEGETDDEYEAAPEDLAVLLEQLRQAGALRDPGADGRLTGMGEGDEEQVDWGESGDEHEDIDT
ncbi:uncharacterized protein C8Q71DRAFT_697197 [Rhodofomes roseus]|uniref:HIT-type domain-containing protein n=1 Tax=Rhodofomes roseus TaxID=34475 RepID=A0ABQ8KYB9_9APHY|nr:uncharacterized protein C8Q71DRAFT_697197 [Rhodofomes roseus]KAH9844201.1 hypothetical protein C8Q71DRAFT_697197 [Rhodofomes roseus]